MALKKHEIFRKGSLMRCTGVSGNIQADIGGGCQMRLFLPVTKEFSDYLSYNLYRNQNHILQGYWDDGREKCSVNLRFYWRLSDLQSLALEDVEVVIMSNGTLMITILDNPELAKALSISEEDLELFGDSFTIYAELYEIDEYGMAPWDQAAAAEHERYMERLIDMEQPPVVTTQSRQRGFFGWLRELFW